MSMSETPGLIDIGANLTHSSFKPDLDAVLDRARDADVTGIMVTGTDVDGSVAAAELAAQYPGFLWATAGIHPHDASAATDEALAKIEALAKLPQVKAIGETGLDFNRDYSPRDAQLAAFSAQLDLAEKTQLPVFIHERDAADDMVRILSQRLPSLSRVVVHCFTGSAEALQHYIGLGCYIGITGWICDERRGLHLRELVATIPDDRLMIETDAPYLMPRDYPVKKSLQSSRRNEPCTLAHTAATVAECRGESLQAMARQCELNTRAFFALD